MIGGTLNRLKQAAYLWVYCLAMIPVMPFFAFYGSIRILRGKASASFGPDLAFTYNANQSPE